MDILTDSVNNEYISRQQAHDFIISIGEMRTATFDYLTEYLTTLDGHFSKMSECATDLVNILDHACGQDKTVEKQSFIKTLGNIFSIRKSSENTKEKLQLK